MVWNYNEMVSEFTNQFCVAGSALPEDTKDSQLVSGFLTEGIGLCTVNQCVCGEEESPGITIVPFC